MSITHNWRARCSWAAVTYQLRTFMCSELSYPHLYWIIYERSKRSMTMWSIVSLSTKELMTAEDELHSLFVVAGIVIAWHRSLFACCIEASTFNWGAQNATKHWLRWTTFPLYRTNETKRKRKNVCAVNGIENLHFLMHIRPNYIPTNDAINCFYLCI